MNSSGFADLLTAKNFALLLLYLAAQTLALFFMKYGLYIKDPYLLMPFMTKYFLLGVICLALQAVCWQKLLRGVDLSLAYASCSVFVILNLVVSRLAFSEAVTLKHFVGGVLLCSGVIIIVLSKKAQVPSGRERG